MARCPPAVRPRRHTHAASLLRFEHGGLDLWPVLRLVPVLLAVHVQPAPLGIPQESAARENKRVWHAVPTGPFFPAPAVHPLYAPQSPAAPVVPQCRSSGSLPGAPQRSVPPLSHLLFSMKDCVWKPLLRCPICLRTLNHVWQEGYGNRACRANCLSEVVTRVALAASGPAAADRAAARAACRGRAPLKHAHRGHARPALEQLGPPPARLECHPGLVGCLPLCRLQNLEPLPRNLVTLRNSVSHNTLRRR